MNHKQLTMNNTITDIQVTTIDGTNKQLSEYQGKVLLIVNVASYCGYTHQYEALESLNKKYSSAGLQILAFPCNDYGMQEPGTNEEIAEFCTTKYKVTFELFDKVHAIGYQKHPLYERLTKAVEPKKDIAWNFEKFLVNKQGEVVTRFSSGTAPESPELVGAIERELAK
jgi:glutathione peroxidase